MNRRNFLQTCSIVPAVLLPGCSLVPASNSGRNSTFIKPIIGTSFVFENHNQLGAKYWNSVLSKFTTEQWKTLVFDMYEIGMEYLQMVTVSYKGKTYYPSRLQPRHDFACEDPLEAVLSAADECGAKFFISNDYWADWAQISQGMTDEKTWILREKGMEEIAEKYGHHKSFYGWYYAHETQLRMVWDDVSINYVNRSSKIARSVTPGAVTMVGPYGTQSMQYNEPYIRQLEQLDVDIIAYQDEVGVYKVKAGEAGQYFEHLYKMHVKAGRSRLWAVVENFDYEGEIYNTPGVPTTFERMMLQTADVSPYVEHIIICQYPGLMSKPGSIAFAGHKDSAKLYTDYVQWLHSTNK